MTDEELREIIDPVSSTLPLALLSSLQPQQLAHISRHTKLAFPVYIRSLQGSEAAKMIAILLETPGNLCPMCEPRVLSCFHWESTGVLKVR